ncbi:hypothetical protein ANTQUA_LOCUS781 [Anthophora quadrimaculata]
MLRLISNNLIKQKQNSTLVQSVSAKTLRREASNAPTKTKNVAGLSDKCVKVPNTSVGPGAAKDKEYKNPEYFCYHVDTFGEAEVELEKYRLPAPSNKVPFRK